MHGIVYRARVFNASTWYYSTSSDGDERAEALLAFSMALAQEDWRGPHTQAGRAGPQFWICADCGLPVGQALRDALLLDAPILHIFDTSWWILAPTGTHGLVVSRFRAMQKNNADAFIPTTAFASGFVQYVSGVWLPAVWQGARYISRHYPEPCFEEKPRRLRLMPSHKWAFTDVSNKESERASLGTLVGDSNMETFGSDAWNIFALHCTAGGDPCFAMNMFLMMTEKVAWSFFDPPQLAPQVVPHTMMKDLLGDFLMHDAALFLADQPEKVLFHELYAAGVPIFAPSVDTLAWKLLPVEPVAEELMGKEWALLRRNGTWQLSDLMKARRGFAVEPFDLAEESHGHFKSWYWLQLADWAWAPHVAHFRGVADLLLQASKADLGAMTKGMREFYTAEIARSGEVFAHTLGKLMRFDVA